MAALRTVWSAFVGVYEETLVLLAGNVATLALNLPLFLVVFLPFSSEDESVTQLVAVVTAWLLPFLPTPGNLALAGLTRVVAGPDIPRFAEFRSSLANHWKLGLRSSVVSLVILDRKSTR